MSRTQRLALITSVGLLVVASTYFVAMRITTQVTASRVNGVLTTVRDTTLEGLVVWMDDIRRQVSGWAGSAAIVAQATQLASLPRDVAQLRSHPAQAALRSTLSPVSMEDHSRGYFLVGADNVVLASSYVAEIGEPSLLAENAGYFDALLNAHSFVTIPLQRLNTDGEPEAVILAGAPILSGSGEVIAGLVFYIDPLTDFSRILQAGRLLDSGETYAVSRDGLLVSESRFDEQLRAAGIIGPDQSSILNISVTDPGANLLNGEEGQPQAQRPLTRMAASLTQMETGSDVTGYRDYRGVNVAGAWTWNEEYGFGIATEADWDESFANVTAIRPALILLGVLSGAALAGTVVLSTLSERQERVAQKRHELTVEGAMDAIISFDSQDRITAWNSQAEKMFGWSKDQAIGTSLASSILPDELKRRYYRRLESLEARQEDLFAGQRREMDLRRRDGSSFPSEFFIVPYELGPERGFSAFIRDVTDIREARRQIEQTHEELTLSYDATLRGWSSALDLRDNETEGHTQRVTSDAMRLAQALGVPEEERIHIYRGALLHDIGKIGVPDRVLLKPGPLNDEEWAIMRQHPVYARNFLNGVPYLRPALQIPYSHHEKWDGSGYPEKMAGETIPYAARMFAVVDVWDALTSDRPYRKAWPAEKARNHLRDQSGTHFDPAIVDVFLTLH
jgi:PAS domain S-box-containing protein